ncbi:MerR family transcriptional regulator [Kribbella sp. WER1]
MEIGELARRGGVSARMLRHYDRIGLLTPARTDPNGRRWYGVDQLARLHRLVALKGLGFGLDEVGVLLDEGVGAEELRGMLRLREAELERRVRHDRHALDRVTARLRLIDEEDRMNVQVKHLDAVTVAALTTTAPRDSVDLEAVFDRVIERMAGADRTAPIARIEPLDEATVEVTAGYVVPAESVPGLETRRLPAATVASTIHQGPMTDLPYDVLRDWAGERAAGCWRQLFLEADGDQDRWIVELQLELDPAN